MADEENDDLPTEPTPDDGSARASMLGNIQELAIEDELKGSYLTYAMSVIVSSSGVARCSAMA